MRQIRGQHGWEDSVSFQGLNSLPKGSCYSVPQPPAGLEPLQGDFLLKSSGEGYIVGTHQRILNVVTCSLPSQLRLWLHPVLGSNIIKDVRTGAWSVSLLFPLQQAPSQEQRGMSPSLELCFSHFPFICPGAGGKPMGNRGKSMGWMKCTLSAYPPGRGFKSRCHTLP